MNEREWLIGMYDQDVWIMFVEEGRKGGSVKVFYPTWDWNSFRQKLWINILTYCWIIKEENKMIYLGRKKRSNLRLKYVQKWIRLDEINKIGGKIFLISKPKWNKISRPNLRVSWKSHRECRFQISWRIDKNPLRLQFLKFVGMIFSRG